LPNVIDKAAIELVDSLQQKLDALTAHEFTLAKKKSFDSIASTRYELSTLSDKYFNKIIEKDYRFFNYLKMENYSKSLRKEDLIKFYNDVFIEPNLKLTVYVIRIFTP
jgi:secreted Zn-dependent insulinase-like peptidase